MTMTTATAEERIGFKAHLAEQRWDDHRYYHHSMVNQSLHFVSAVTFLCAYALLFKDPAIASLLAWGVAMTSRQAGHFFFEPKGYDHVNEATHEHKEDIKIGYNLARKWILMSIWASCPVLLLISPTLFGAFDPLDGAMGFLRHLGIMWLVVGVGGIIFRAVHLFFLYDVQTGLVWATKIVTDPFNDFKLYHKSPIRLIKGERIDGGLATH
ncbi:hypothetical protein [Sphingomonas sp. ID0503]|uniref:hypothetical protein n=1 Tax=Sphingomonas sp. ID0503 TaxID=3399691 RepID=UPI003AFB2658